MNWIPVEIEADCLDTELIKEILCKHIDANDFAEKMWNEIYGKTEIGNFLVPTGTALRRIFETEDGDEWEGIVEDVLEREAEEIEWELENNGDYFYLSFHFILIDEEEDGE